MSWGSDGDKGFDNSGDQVNIGVVAYFFVNVLHDDKTQAAPCEGEVNARGPYSIDVVVFKVFRDKALRLGLALGDMTPKLDPDIADLVMRTIFESDSDTADVGGGSLRGTESKTPQDDRLAAWNIRWLVCTINKSSDVGGHDGSY